MIRFPLRIVLLASLLAAWAGGVFAQQLLDWSPEEIGAVGQHGPWPPPPVRDPSNRVSGTPAGIALGEHLFNDPRLSGDGRMNCATCHQGKNKPMGGFQMAKDYHALWGAPTPAVMAVVPHAGAATSAAGAPAPAAGSRAAR